jgi:hypothetical protein
MLESGVDDGIRRGYSAAQAFQVFQIASLRLSAGGGERLGARNAASQAEHLVAGVD